jgi:hypothetical protein
MITVCFDKSREHVAAYSGFGDGDINKAERFALFLQDYTLAKITKVSATRIRLLTGGQESNGDFGSVLLYAHLWFTDADGKNWGFKLHAPKDTMFNDDNSVKQAIGEAIALELALVAGETLTYKEGWLCGQVE